MKILLATPAGYLENPDLHRRVIKDLILLKRRLDELEKQIPNSDSSGTELYSLLQSKVKEIISRYPLEKQFNFTIDRGLRKHLKLHTDQASDSHFIAEYRIILLTIRIYIQFLVDRRVTQVSSDYLERVELSIKYVDEETAFISDVTENLNFPWCRNSMTLLKEINGLYAEYLTKINGFDLSE